MRIFILVLVLIFATTQAQANDRQMKALIVGTWTMDCNNIKLTTTYEADGTETFNLDGTDYIEKWDVKDGYLVEADDPGTGRPTYSKILFLTKHEWLLLGTSTHNKGYFFYYKED